MVVIACIESSLTATVNQYSYLLTYSSNRTGNVLVHQPLKQSNMVDTPKGFTDVKCRDVNDGVISEIMITVPCVFRAIETQEAS